MRVERIACMAHCFGNGEISIMQLNVFADKSDMYGVSAILDPFDKACPL